MKCNFYISKKHRLCRNSCSKINYCHCHNKIVAKSKISNFIFHRRFYFYRRVYYKKVLHRFFMLYCFSHKLHECSICLDTIERHQELKLSCNHYFHKKCIIQFLEKSRGKKKCPYCRSDVLFQDSNYLRLKSLFIVRMPMFLYNLYFGKRNNLRDYYQDNLYNYIYANLNFEVLFYYIGTR